MTVAYRLLSSLVDLAGHTPDSLAERLTFAGFEVEGKRRLAQASKLVVGKVLTCRRHPESDHLHLLTIDCGSHVGNLSVVCGAPNAREGIKVIVALPGCELPSIRKTIQAGEILHAPSQGMCCSLVELGLPASLLPEEEVDGIHELDDAFRVGDSKVIEHLGLDDVLLEVDVLPNRPDALSLIGLAREVSALLGAPMKTVPSVNLAKLPRGKKILSQANGCAKADLALAEVGGFDEKAYREVKLALLASGHACVSPLVDVGNWAMVLTGQPFHVYDAEKLEAFPLCVRDDCQGHFEGLDGKGYELQRGDLVVTSKGKPVSIGGVIGGAETAVSAKTRSVALEAAAFYHADVRRTALRLGLSSASSLLFSKGVNPLSTDASLGVLLAILKKVFPKTKIRSFSSSTPKGKPLSLPKPFAYSPAKTNRRLGSDYSPAKIDAVLQAFKIKRVGRGKVLPPAWRTDLKEQSDIDEEVFRFYPSDQVKPSYQGLPLTDGGLTKAQRDEWLVRDFLVHNGLFGAMTFTLVDEAMSTSIRVFDDGPCYRVFNPLTADHEWVRVDLLPSLVEAIALNASHKKEDFGLFEISAVDSPRGNRRLLSLGLCGRRKGQEDFQSRPYDFYDLSGLVEGILSLLGISSSRYVFARSKNPAFHPGKSADLLFGKELLGTFGALFPGKFEGEYLVGELDLSRLLSIPSGRIKFAPFPSHPSVRRDLSFTLRGPVSYREMESMARRAGKGLVKEVVLFDHYEGKDKSSLGICLILGGEKTLREEEILSAVDAVIAELTSKLPLSIASSEQGR